jgi:hypothetical protein
MDRERESVDFVPFYFLHPLGVAMITQLADPVSMSVHSNSLLLVCILHHYQDSRAQLVTGTEQVGFFIVNTLHTVVAELKLNFQCYV